MSGFLAGIAAAIVWTVSLGAPAALTQRTGTRAPSPTPCERQAETLRKSAPPSHGWRFGATIKAPQKLRGVSPAYPAIPPGTTGGGVWIGEILIDAHGRVANVWTIRDVKLKPPLPSLNRAITHAVRKWEFLPAEWNSVPVAVCETIAVNVNITAIERGGRPTPRGRQAGPRAQRTRTGIDNSGRPTAVWMSNSRSPGASGTNSKSYVSPLPIWIVDGLTMA
jgi:hypothetical protein